MTDTVSKGSLTVAVLSTIVEWYDFTLYLYFATVLSVVFFGDGSTSILMVLSGFAISYLMRPLGAMVFGRIGDKYGRKNMLMASMLLMGVAMFATAALPTAVQFAGAGAMMVALRCVMAFAVGAEYTGVVAYLLEGSKGQRRGLLTSLASASSEIGALLAVFVCSMTVLLVPDGQLQAWGWRIPFVLGGVMALLVLFFRGGMEESPKFLASKPPKKPFSLLLKNHKRAVFNSFMISALGSITYYVGIVYVPVFLTQTVQLGDSVALWLSTFAALVVIAITPVVGHVSDVVGRRATLLLLAFFGVIIPPVAFFLMLSGETLWALAGATLLALLAGAVSAVGASATAEQFSTATRLSGLALGTTVATAIFGGFTPLLSTYLLQSTGWQMTPAFMMAGVAIMVLPVFYGLKETAFDDLL